MFDRLQPNDAHIWILDLTSDSGRDDYYLSLLNNEEKKRAAQFHHPSHRHRFIITRGTLRQLLANYLNVFPASIEFAYTENKKPYLPGSLYFNVSHSHEMALLAFTLENPVGVDIEKVRESYNPGIVSRYFTTLENERINSLPEAERIIAFYQLWSRKEAIIKATGKSLGKLLNAFSVEPSNVTETIDIGPETWHLVPLMIRPNYQAALATKNKLENIFYYDVSTMQKT